MSRQTLPSLTLALVSGLSLVGCGAKAKPVHPVQGQVLFQGKPTPQAVVIFHPEATADPRDPRPVGYVDDRGAFRLTSHAAGDGAPEGTYRVSIAWNLAQRVAGRPDETVTTNHLPPRYASPETSGLRVTVGRGQNQLEPFTLSR